jgi:hypothetical protein
MSFANVVAAPDTAPWRRLGFYAEHDRRYDPADQ